MQQGVVDGQENPYSVINASRYFEVQKYLSNTGHFFDFINVVANRRAFEALSPAQQKQLRESMHKAVVWQRERARAEENESIAEIRKRGTQFDEVSPQFRDQLRKASAGVVDDVRKMRDRRPRPMLMSVADQGRISLDDRRVSRRSRTRPVDESNPTAPWESRQDFRAVEPARISAAEGPVLLSATRRRPGCRSLSRTIRKNNSSKVVVGWSTATSSAPCRVITSRIS